MPSIAVIQEIFVKRNEEVSIPNISRKQGFAAGFEAAASLLVNTDGHTEVRKTTEYSEQMAFLHTRETSKHRG